MSYFTYGGAYNTINSNTLFHTKSKKQANASLSVENNSQILANLIRNAAPDSLLMSESNRATVGKVVLSLQSFDPNNESLAQNVQSIQNNIEGISAQYQDETGEQLTDEQIDNIRESVVIAQDPQSYVNSMANSNKGAVISAVGSSPDVGPLNLANTPGADLSLSKESFEIHGMINTMAMTVQYNIKSERQAKAVENFFPTISLDPTTTNITMKVHTSSVFLDAEYALDGSGDIWRNQKNIIRSLRDHTVLKSNFTDIVPVFRPGVNESSFVDKNILPPYTVKTDYNENIMTSLLVPGREINIIAISQTDRMVALGSQNSSDQISPNPRLKTLGLKVGDDVVLFQNLQYLSQSQFHYAPTGDREGYQLAYDVNTHKLDKDTVGAVSGTLPAKLQALKDKNLEVLLRIMISGQGNTDTGSIVLSPSQVVVKSVRNAETKEVLSAEDPAIKTLIDDLEASMSIVGYAIDATRTNSNIREHGLLLDDRVRNIIYGVKLHSPIGVRRPVSDTDSVTDADRIDTLTKMSFIRRTNEGVTALYDILNMLKAQPEQLDITETFNHSHIGCGQFFVRNCVRDLTIDMYKLTQSMQTSDRLNNINSVFTNFILSEMAEVYSVSELASAYAISNIGTGKPHIVGMADAFTHKFIFREGDARTLGNGFDFTIDECVDDRLTDGNKDGEVGTIFLAFGKPLSGNLNVPLWFGSTLDKMEIPRIITRTRGSAVQHELMVQPWFSHIVHTPILVRIKVLNLKKAIQERIPYAVAVVNEEGAPAATTAGTPTPVSP